MNELKTFTHEEFGQVNVLVIKGEPWFISKEVSELLGYADPDRAIRENVREKNIRVTEKREFPLLDSVEGNPVDIPDNGLTIVNETGLCTLMYHSTLPTLPTARRFLRWVISKVLSL